MEMTVIGEQRSRFKRQQKHRENHKLFYEIKSMSGRTYMGGVFVASNDAEDECSVGVGERFSRCMQKRTHE